MQGIYPIRVVTQRTGLSPHVIRVWERRYQAVRPKRTRTNRRLYTEEDLERLIALKSLTDMGYNIGSIANLSLDSLKKMKLDGLGKGESPLKALPVIPQEVLEFYFTECIQKIKSLDAKGLEGILTSASIALNQRQLIEQIITPLMIKIGELWEDGELQVYHEHIASSIVRTFISNLKEAYEIRPSAPVLVLATPSGQSHEMGALLVSKLAASKGWKVLYLGANLPAEDIALAVNNSQAQYVGLSLTYSDNDEQIIEEIEKLKKLMEPQTDLLVGGRLAPQFNEAIEANGGRVIPNLSVFENLLNAYQ